MIDRKYTEQEWRALEELRRDWPAFCDGEPAAPGFADRMEDAGLIEPEWLNTKQAKRVVESDMHWEGKYGSELPSMIYVLTPAGRAALEDNGHG